MREPQIVSPAPSSHVSRFQANTSVAPVTLSEHFGVISRHRALVAAVAITVSLGGLVYAYSKSPVYEGNLLISVADLRSTEQRNVLGSPVLSADRKTAMSESEILRSRVVLGPVVDKLRMDVSVGPKYLPVIGSAIAKLNAGRFSVKESLAGYAWGGEKIAIGKLEVPASMLGVNLVVTKLDGDQFRIEEAERGINAVGRLGVPLSIHSREGAIVVQIDQLVAAKGTQFNLQKNPRVIALEALRTALTVAELGKDSGMISVNLTDNNPEKVRSVLNEIGSTYMNFVQGQKEEQTSTSLAVLEAQLPGLKKQVELAESRYEDFRRAHGTADLAEETKLRLGRYSTTQAQLSDLRQKREEMSARLGDSHPLLVALDRQIQAVQREGNAVSAEIRSFPSVSKELERRARALQNETEIYNSVARKIEEMKVIAQDRSTNVKVVDDAVVPAVPKGSRLAILGFFIAIGIFLGIFSAFLRRMFSKPVNT